MAEAFTHPAAPSLWAQLKQPWHALARWPALKWLAARSVVGVQMPGGEVALWQGDRRLPVDPRARLGAATTALALAPDDQLERRLVLPLLPQRDLHDAIALDVRMASPFDPDDLVWGWRRDADRAGGWTCTAVMTSRRVVKARLESADDAAKASVPEVWAFSTDGRPVVLQGFGESARQRRERNMRRAGVGLLVLAGLMAAAAALTPTVQLTLRAMQADRAHADLERQLAPTLAARESLLKAQTQHEALRAAMADRVEPLAVIDLLTQAVPDDTFVQRLQWQGGKLTLAGQTPNTSTLMNKLSGLPQVRDVKAPAPATRANAGRENFTIELTLQPAAASSAASAATSARPASQAASEARP